MSGPGTRRWMAGAAILAVSAGTATTGPEPTAQTVGTRAWIAEETTAGGVVFVAYFRADTGFIGRYELLATRWGASGNSTVRQGGIVDASPGRTVRLSQVAMGPDRKDHRHEIRLLIMNGDVVLTQDRLTR